MSDENFLFLGDDEDSGGGDVGTESGGSGGALGPGPERPWKVLVVDDEESIHAVTRMSLQDFVFEGRPVVCLGAFSAAEAKEILHAEDDVAMILLDVVMEENDSGLQLVKWIRQVLGDVFVRIILRTGQPGEAPEETVVIDYDINDYKEKTDLTAGKLRTAVASALRGYQDLLRLEGKRRELAEARKYQSCIINAIHSVLFTVDEELRIRLWNRSAERVFRVSRQRALGRSLFDVMPSAEPFAEDFLAAVESGRVTRLRDTVVYLDRPRTVNLGIFPVVSEEEIAGAVVLVEDLTLLKEKDAQLQRSQKMEALGTLAAGLAHDVNNVLVGITGPVSLLELEYPSEHLEMVKDSARRASEIVQQFLRLSRPGEAVQKPVDLRRVLDRVMGLCRSALDKSVAVHTRIPGEPALILGDGTQLEQVLLNLALNGAHAMTVMRDGDDKDSGGDEDSARRDGDSARRDGDSAGAGDAGGNAAGSDGGGDAGGELVLALERADGGRWRLTVTDEGVGIAPENLEKIFEPFFTTKDENRGSGLGLSMVRTIVEDHGGTVQVESQVGEGTSVILEFPEAEAGEDAGFGGGVGSAGLEPGVLGDVGDAGMAGKAGKAGMAGKEPEFVRGTGRILLCDDENIMRRVGQRLLSKCGYEPVLASSGQEALDIFAQQGDSLDGVILDIMMPDLSGMEVFRRMREEKPGIKVILTSGFGEGDRIDRALAEGVDAFLPKPYTLQSFSSQLAAVLKGAGGSSAG